eukprot:198633-Chlamydomonas_euryale.AAC.1
MRRRNRRRNRITELHQAGLFLGGQTLNAERQRDVAIWTRAGVAGGPRGFPAAAAAPVPRLAQWRRRVSCSPMHASTPTHTDSGWGQAQLGVGSMADRDRQGRRPGRAKSR